MTYALPGTYRLALPRLKFGKWPKRDVDSFGCHLQVKTVRELRNFSDGKRWVESLRVSYRTDRYSDVKMQTYFSLGTPVQRKIINSEYGGTVEEIRLWAEDRLNHWIIFQHNGRGEIVWFEMGNNHRLNP